MKKDISRITALILCAGVLLTACGENVVVSPVSPEQESTQDMANADGETQGEITFQTGRSSFMGEEVRYDDPSIVPCVPAIEVADDFSNVYDPLDYLSEDSYMSYLNMKDLLLQNHFAVTDLKESEFFDVYETNRYQMMPSFITVDSLMHTYHLYFAYLMKHTELNFLSGQLSDLSAKMQEGALAQYEALQGTEWESAAAKVAAYFTIGASLQEESVLSENLDAEILQIVTGEREKILACEQIGQSLITGENEDYSQYKVRGYYEGTPALEGYFRAMMWYGRCAFEARNAEHDRCALLINLLLSSQAQEFSSWEQIYEVTSFFAGASDDCGYYEYAGAMQEAFGKVPEVSELPKLSAEFETFTELVQQMDPPQINSIPVDMDEENVIISYRFMGQRFTVDAAIMQNLIYRAVGENPDGELRMLPDALDVPAALGSEAALDLLTQVGATAYDGYSEHMEMLQTALKGDDAKLWNASLYASWLSTLRPLLEERGEGYPTYMQSDAWDLKNLETFAGSYAELKHDTILYAKQTMAEMGSGDMEEYDDRGYVDPQPQVYSRFINLSKNTAEGLAKLEMLSDADAENLERLTYMAQMMLTISEKELQDQLLTDEEYDFIRCYGGDLEHFWLEVNQEDFDDELIYSFQAPGAIVADIATDPNGQVLEVATGDACDIFVIVPIDGALRLTRGSVYSFYQFTQPLSDRLTDEAWRELLQPQYDANYNLIEGTTPTQPEWTQGYRSVSNRVW
ncbi:MAG: DUF3160 domain-containing protein [Lachnospiraceae bacterium]|nr:DUF3160 domain-containing protein [Lachnospiraceae bacterium]